MSESRNHGGPRPGSGRRSLFPNKVPLAVSVSLTAAARDKLDAAARRLRASKSDVVEALIRRYCADLSFEGNGDGDTPAKQAHTGAVGLLRDMMASDAREAISQFKAVYRQDWQAWIQVCEGRPLTDPAVVARFTKILGKWQAVRPNPLRRPRSAGGDGPFMDDLLSEAQRILCLLSSFDLRHADALSIVERRALISLWELFTALPLKGRAGAVGITKAIMLVTGGRVGPALDSLVRGKLGRKAKVAGPEQWLALLAEIAGDIREFESREGVRLEELGGGQLGAVAVGRVYDMVAGPRRKFDPPLALRQPAHERTPAGRVGD